MNPNLCRIVLRPRQPLEVLDLALVLLRHRWRPYFRLGLWVVGPLWLALSVAAWWGSYTESTVMIAPVILVLLLSGPLIEAPFTLMTGRLLFQDDVGVWETIRDTLARLPAMIIPLVLRGSIGWIPFFVDAAMVFVTEAALLERVGPGRALQRSTLLAGGNAAQAWAGALSWYALLIWCGAVGELTGQAIVRDVLQLGQPFGNVMAGELTPYLIGGLLLGRPLLAIYRLLLYVDSRTRSEGWDLQVGLRAAGLS